VTAWSQQQGTQHRFSHPAHPVYGKAQTSPRRFLFISKILLSFYSTYPYSLEHTTHLIWTLCTKPEYHCKPFIKCQDTSSYFEDKQACYCQSILNCYLTKHLLISST